MSIWEAIILGIVQGLSEFLPISSSGHSVLLQRIFSIENNSLVFDTCLHAGSLIAVLVVLRHDIWNLLKRIVQPQTLYLIIATVPTVIAALLFKDKIEHAFATAAYLGFSFLITSLILFASEKLHKRNVEEPVRSREEMNWKDALLIGILQMIAIFPGISRSGATISAGLSRRLNREFAARFAFLLSIPAILGALVLQLKDLRGGEGAGAMDVLPIAAGSISAGIVAFFSIRLALKIVREHTLLPFSIYTGILGCLILFDKFFTGLFF